MHTKCTLKHTLKHSLNQTLKHTLHTLNTLKIRIGSTVVKGNAKKVRRIGKDILVGFAGQLNL